MIPYLGSEISAVLRNRSRTSSRPPVISAQSPHFNISNKPDSVLSRCVAEMLAVFNRISVMVPRSTTARAVTLALYFSSR